MDNEQLILLSVKLVTGFAAALTAVLLWSKTRETPWLLVVVGTLFLYGEVVFSMLAFFGISNFYLFTVYGISVIRLVFSFSPFLFFTAGFLIFLLRRRGRF
ncbi:MAG: hypothetical protein GY786_09790 [Proteobacteria bacterium]|nr:hypothetical protein [Pseudomonadota bacterium]